MPIPNLASATYTAQADVDALDIDIIQAGANGTGVTSGCACTPNASGSTLVVAVASGTAIVNGTAVTVGSGTVTPGAANATNPRFDLVVVNSSAVKSIIAGTAAAAPVFPAAAPSTYAVLAAVYIPANATSITSGNIVDKRQMLLADAAATTASLRTIGTSSTQAAAGDHLHSGQYASTAHASTHDLGGSDPITALNSVKVDNDDGTGWIEFTSQTADVPAPANDNTFRVHARWQAWNPVLFVRGANHNLPVDPMHNPYCRWALVPNNSTTTAPLFGTVTETGTKSHVTANGLGYRINYATAASTNANGTAESVKLAWCRGDVVQPWYGWYMRVAVIFPDASYNAAGATTGSRIFIGFTDQSVATIFGSDNPAGHRAGFQRINVNGGKTQTNFFTTNKDGTTEALTDTAIALAQNKLFVFHCHAFPASSYIFYQLDNVTDGTSTGSFFDGNNIPGNTTFMRFVCGIQTINATARNLQVQYLSIAAPTE